MSSSAIKTRVVMVRESWVKVGEHHVKKTEKPRSEGGWCWGRQRQGPDSVGLEGHGQESECCLEGTGRPWKCFKEL